MFTSTHNLPGANKHTFRAAAAVAAAGFSLMLQSGSDEIWCYPHPASTKKTQLIYLSTAMICYWHRLTGEISKPG